MSRSVMAWVIPASGVRPRRGYWSPCARWHRSPGFRRTAGGDVGDSLRDQLHVRLVALLIIPSATTAESSDSIAASRATVSAGEKIARVAPEDGGPVRQRER